MAKSVRYYLFIVILTTLPLIGVSCDHPARIDEQQPAAEEVLLLDDAPLLLADSDQENGEADDTAADNSRCFVCHINYSTEAIAVVHARAGMGCAACHGESDAHIADESWASGGNGTAPETMYPRDKINPFCMGCHTKDKIDTKQHKPLFAANTKKCCTDCHGKHRLPIRRCKWK